MNGDPNMKEEKDLQLDEVNWTGRKERAAEHPPTGASKKGSLLKDLADEALSKGRPVLVIPLDAADPQTGQPAGEDDEPPHELRLPKNTTVIIAGESGFPATPGMSRARHVRGDLGEEVARRLSPSDIRDRVVGVRIVTPSQAGVRWNPLSGESATAESEAPDQPDRAQGGHR